MLNTTPKPVLDTPDEVKESFNCDIETLLQLRFGRLEEDRERLTAKANAVESGLIALTRAVKSNPEDADAAYCEVLEKFTALEAQETNVGLEDPLHVARIQGRKQGIEHVLYRIRGARR